MKAHADDATTGADLAPGADSEHAYVAPGAAGAFDTDSLCVFPDPARVTPEGGPDPVDQFIADWGRERPDLDASIFGCFIRMKMFSKNLAGAADRVLRHHGLNPGEFEVLAALRGSGPPCTMIPSQLSSRLMMSRAAMTNRLDRLEAAGMVERTLDPDDRRSFLVRLTDRGRSVIDGALTEHAQLVNRLGGVLSPEQRQHLDEALRALLRTFQ